MTTTTRVIQGGVVASFIVLAGVLGWKTFEPPKLEWVSVSSPLVEPTKLTISAETRRRPIDGCTNGPQIELRRLGEEVRLPIPTRTIRANVSTYETVLVDPLRAGRYTIKLRESVICPGLTQVIESPGIEFVVQ